MSLTLNSPREQAEIFSWTLAGIFLCIGRPLCTGVAGL